LPVLQLEGLTKRYGDKAVVDDLHVEIGEGEFFSLLGASGCGKTTTLRMMAGLERPDVGRLRFGDEIWAAPLEHRFVPPQQRAIGMVFQSYALWPHMTVFENVAYPLRIRRQPTSRVPAILDLVHLGAYAQRSAARLSGGQQQRVALARALACDPRILLLDEPFSNLDVNLRQSLRVELRAIQQRLGLTVVLVTHDQADAFALSDRIGVMRDGRLEQVGPGEQIYQAPSTPFVRDFVGRTVVLDASIVPQGGRLRLDLPGGHVAHVPVSAAARAVAGPTRGTVSVRPEDLTIDDAEHPDLLTLFAGLVTSRTYLGDHVEAQVTNGDGVAIRVSAGRQAALGLKAAARVQARAQDLRVWPGEQRRAADDSNGEDA